MQEYTKIFRESKAEKILHIVKLNKLPFDDEVVEDIIVDLIQDIYYKQNKIANIEKRLLPLIEETGYQLHTIPGVNIVTAAKLISEIGSIERFKSHKQLARYAGIAPVTVGSAGKNANESSQGGKRQLRATLHFMAIGMITIDKNDKARHPVSRDYFLQKLRDGKSKPQALVSIMRQLVQIIFSMMKNKSAWDMPIYKQQLTLTKEGKVVDR